MSSSVTRRVAELLRRLRRSESFAGLTEKARQAVSRAATFEQLERCLEAEQLTAVVVACQMGEEPLRVALRPTREAVAVLSGIEAELLRCARELSTLFGVHRIESSHPPSFHLWGRDRANDPEGPRERAGLLETVRPLSMTVVVARGDDDVGDLCAVEREMEDRTPEVSLGRRRTTVEVPTDGKATCTRLIERRVNVDVSSTFVVESASTSTQGLFGRLAAALGLRELAIKEKCAREVMRRVFACDEHTDHFSLPNSHSSPTKLQNSPALS